MSLQFTPDAPAALVLLHVQNEVVDAHGAIGGKGLSRRVDDSGLLSRLAAAIAAADSTGVPVVHVVFVAVDGSCRSSAKGLRAGARTAFVAGSWGTQVAAGLRRPDHLVVEHDTMSAFAGTELAPTLRAQGVRRVVLAGVSTHLVVSATAFAAADLGFDVAAFAEGCVAPDDATHQAALIQMGAVGDIV